MGPRRLQAPLKDDVRAPHARGRRYDAARGKEPGGIRLDDVVLGVKLAQVSITDNKPGTLEAIGKLNPWHIDAMAMITGSREAAFLPLTTIMHDCLGYTVDRIFSRTTVGGLHAVDTQGYIAHNDQDVVLAYRCTIGITDWVTNLAASHSVFEPLQDRAKGHSGLFSCCEMHNANTPRVHTGFYNAFLVSLRDIEEALLPHLQGHQPKRIIVVGHSLGAGIASVAFAYFLTKFDFATLPHKLLLVTAGGPRAFDANMASWVDSHIARLRPLDKCQACRLVCRDDVVPAVPPEFLDFCHHRKLVYVTEEGELLVGPDVSEAEDEHYGLLAGLQGPPLPGGLPRQQSGLPRQQSGLPSLWGQEAQELEQYAMIPQKFRDHMPQSYLLPLLRHQQELKRRELSRSRSFFEMLQDLQVPFLS